MFTCESAVSALVKCWVSQVLVANLRICSFEWRGKVQHVGWICPDYGLSKSTTHASHVDRLMCDSSPSGFIVLQRIQGPAFLTPNFLASDV